MEPKPDPRRDLRNVAYQTSRFGVALERMNREAIRERNRQKVRVAGLIVAFLLALALGWTLKDAPAKIAATVLQAEAMPDSW
jgi:hypothetical protein